MKKLEKQIGYMSHNSVMIIKKIEESYIGCILRYDNEIFDDVQVFDSKSFLEPFPSIRVQLDEGFTYYLAYHLDCRKYQSGLMLWNSEDGFSWKQEMMVDDLHVLDDSMIGSMIGLDHSIAKQLVSRKTLEKKREL